MVDAAYTFYVSNLTTQRLFDVFDYRKFHGHAEVICGSDCEPGTIGGVRVFGVAYRKPVVSAAGAAASSQQPQGTNGEHSHTI